MIKTIARSTKVLTVERSLELGVGTSQLMMPKQQLKRLESIVSAAGKDRLPI